MVGVTNQIVLEILNAYNLVMGKFPPFLQTFITLFLWSLLLFGYGWVIWIFYRSVSKKNILGLDLNKYNKSEHPFFTKVLAGILYLIEYILILPVLIFVWFGVFTLMLIVLAEGIEVSTILIIAIIIIATIRMAAYYKEDLSRDIAKILPFTLLGVMITRPTFFTNFQTIIQNLTKIPLFLGEIGVYLGFIVTLEVILRFFDFIISLFGFDETVKIINDEDKE